MAGESKCNDGGGYFILNQSDKKCKCCTSSNALTSLESMPGFIMYVVDGGGFGDPC